MIARLTAVAHSRRGSAALWGAGVVLSAAVAGKYVGDPTFSRFAFALAALAVVTGIGILHPRALLLSLPVWLVALGLVRRLFTSVAAAGPADPLLLVGPIALIVVTFAAADRGAFRRPTRLSRLVMLYSIAVCFGALNPLQGSRTVGLTALIFFVPILAFWIGRGLVDDALLRRLLIVVGVCAVPAALYGLRQTFVGFPSWDRTWIASQGYVALNVGGTTRPFSTFSSSAEYATFLAIAMLVWLRLGPRRYLRPTALAVVALLAVSVFYQSSRGSIVMLLAGGAVMLAAWRRLPLAAAAALAVAFLLLLPAVVKHLAPKTYSTGTGASALVQHQVQGLSNPLDPNSSTVGAHVTLVVLGMKSVLRNPLGEGIGAVTRSGEKFGGVRNGTEADPSNAAVALGLPGLLLFIGLFATGFGSAYRLARRGDALAGVAAGIVTITALQWLNGGQYSVAFLPWLVLGWIDARLLDAKETAPATEPAVVQVQPRRPRPLPRPVAPLRRIARTAPATPPPAAAQEPREWNVYALADAVGGDRYRRLVLIYLRSYAALSGTLPVEFDPLVRDVFGELAA